MTTHTNPRDAAEYIRLAGFDAGPLPGGQLHANDEPLTRRSTPAGEHFDVVVIGGGQAGLSVGYHLAQRGLRFVILDAEQRVGDVWRKRWDSLHLFTPRHLDALDGMRFPGQRDTFPSKDEMADYLEAYAQRFALPVRSGTKVERLLRRDGRYIVHSGEHRFEAEQVVVAIGSYQTPRVPAFARDLDASIVQLHSSAYKNPAQLRPGAVLIVGAGNSGAEIAMDLAPRHTVHLAGRATGEVPFRITSWLGRNVLCVLLLRLVFHRLLTLKTPIGRKARPKIVAQGGPLIRTKSRQLTAAGVQRTGRVVGVRDGLPLMDDGRVLEVTNVIYCTGFGGGLSFIELPILDADGEPEQASGVVPRAPGLYFVGLHFMHAMSSGMIHGVGRDAARIARAVAERIGVDAAHASQ